MLQDEDTKMTKVSAEPIDTTNEDDAFKEEKEDVFLQEKLADKNKKTLAYKRSFFVRMVSDPKLYNPKIVPTKSVDMNVTALEDQAPKGSLSSDQHIKIEGVKIYDNIQPPSPTV